MPLPPPSRDDAVRREHADAGGSRALRLGVLGIIVLSLFAALFSRLWYLQVMDSTNFQVQASNNQVRIVYEAAPRAASSTARVGCWSTTATRS